MDKHNDSANDTYDDMSTENITKLKQVSNRSDFKSFIRKMEGLIEVVILVLAYYFIWKLAYRGEGFPSYYGNGKYLLAVVYAFLVFVLFYLCESFKFGHRKLTEVLISQCISMVIVNIVTYLQLCLIANRMISVLPMVGLLAIDLVIIVVCTYIFTSIYHHMYVPKNMVMIYGNENAVDLKFKMEERSDKYRITKVMSYKEGSKHIQEEIAGHDAVIINDVPIKIRNIILKYCYTNSVRTYVVPKLSDIILGGGRGDQFI